MILSDTLRPLRCKNCIKAVLSPVLSVALSWAVAFAPVVGYAEPENSSAHIAEEPANTPSSIGLPFGDTLSTNINIPFRPQSRIDDDGVITEEEISDALDEVIESVERPELISPLRKLRSRILPVLGQVNMRIKSKKQTVMAEFSKEARVAIPAILVVNYIMAFAAFKADLHLVATALALPVPLSEAVFAGSYFGVRKWLQDPKRQLPKAQKYIHDQMIQIGALSQVHLLLYTTTAGEELFLAVRNSPEISIETRKIVKESKKNVDTTHMTVADLERIIGNSKVTSSLKKSASSINDYKARLLIEISSNESKRTELEVLIDFLDTPKLSDPGVEALVRLIAIRRHAIAMGEFASVSVKDLFKNWKAVMSNWSSAMEAKRRLGDKARDAMKTERALKLAIHRKDFDRISALETTAKDQSESLQSLIDGANEKVSPLKPALPSMCRHILSSN